MRKIRLRQVGGSIGRSSQRSRNGWGASPTIGDAASARRSASWGHLAEGGGRSAAREAARGGPADRSAVSASCSACVPCDIVQGDLAIRRTEEELRDRAKPRGSGFAEHTEIDRLILKGLRRDPASDRQEAIAALGSR